MLSKKDKRLRNWVEFIVLTIYSISLVLFALTRQPACILLNATSIPVCLHKNVRNFLYPNAE